MSNRAQLKSAAGQVFRQVRASVPPSNLNDAFVAGLAPIAWYRYNQGITQAGGLVSQWSDQSGNANHLLQATGTNQPSLQADGSILFDGVDNFMRATFAFVQPVTAYVVLTALTALAGMRLLAGATNGTAFAYIRWNAGVATSLVYSAPSQDGLIATSVNVPVVDVVVVNGINSLHERLGGGSDSGDSGNNNPGGLTIGGDQSTVPANYSNFSVKEIILFSGAHDSATRGRVLRGLGWMAA